MAVRLIERFADNLPDWFRSALPKTKPSGSYDRYGRRQKTDLVDRRVDNGVSFMQDMAQFPLDKINFEEKPIPRNLKSIERDYTDGNIPVIDLVVPQRERATDDVGHYIYDEQGNPVYNEIDPEEYIIVLKPSWRYSRATNPSTLFKKDLEESFPWDFKRWHGTNWSDFKNYIAHYGVIINGKQDKEDLNVKRTERDKFFQKGYGVPIKDPSGSLDKKARKILQNDSKIYPIYKKLDALYDELMEVFDEALEKIEDMNEDKANGCWRRMQLLKSDYERAISQINDACRNSELWTDDNESVTDTWSFDRAKDFVDNLGDDIEVFKGSYL